jgi:uncharacterized protein
MNAVLASLASIVRRWPVVTLLVVLALTAMLAALSTQVRLAVGNEGVAPDNVHLDAFETLGERFGASGEEVLQLLVEAEPGGEVVSADGLRALSAVTDALTSSSAADHLDAVGDGPPVLGPFTPTLHALELQGAAVDGLDDEVVRTTFLEVQAQLPPEDAATVAALLPEDADLDAASGDAALLLAFVSSDGLPTETIARFDAMVDIHAELTDAAEAAATPGYAVSAFSFPLMFSDTETFEAELARLFASAFAIIVAILATVYWLRPRGLLRPLGAGRRTVADVLLTMATIVMAITWMNGAAVLLGPDHLGVIGPLTEVTQIIPVLLIGLGVDYAIHLTSRYREEVGAGASVELATTRAMRTVGLALGLATLTTAVGFLTNLVNPVPMMQDFGVLAAVGIVAAFVLMLTFVPAARLLVDRRAEAAGRLPTAALQRTSARLLPATMARTAVLAERLPVATLLVTFALGGGLGVWGLSQLETRFSSTDFVASDHPMLAAMDTIEDRFGGGFGETTEVLITGDVTRPETHAALVEATDRLADVPWVTTIDGQPLTESPVALLAALRAPPEPAPPLADGTEGFAAGSEQLAPEAGEAAPDGEETVGDADGVSGDADGVSGDAGGASGDADGTVADAAELGAEPPAVPAELAAFAELADAEGLGADLRFPDGADVTSVYAAAWDAAPAEAERVLALEDGAVTHARFAIQTSAGEPDAAELRDALDEAFVPVAATGVTVVSTSTPIINESIITALQEAQTTSLGTTLGVVLVLLVVSFWIRERRPALGVLTTLPVVLALLWTFAMMAATGIPLGPVTSAIAAIAIGIGIPYSIHVTNRFEEDRRRLPTDEAMRSTVRHTGGALAGSALTSCAGFGVLVTSSLVPFRQFGAVTVYAIGFALLAATLVLPSALTLWDRWHRSREARHAATTGVPGDRELRPREPA